MNRTQDMSSLFEQIWERKVPFFSVFVIVLFISYAILVIIDFVPEEPSEPAGATSTVAVTKDSDNQASSANGGQPDRFFAVEDFNESTQESSNEQTVVTRVTESQEITVESTQSSQSAPDSVPQSLYIDALNRTVPVLNPTSRRVADLDRALESGAVRHPDSADFQREGNIFILGHSSYLPTVNNRNFQVFNGIQNLRWGDTIRLFSNDTEYIYRVERVYEAKASEVVVPVAGTGPMLTLATCDSFGSKDDRFIVEAVLVNQQARS